MPFFTQTQCSLKVFKTHQLAPNVGNNWLEIHKRLKPVVLILCLFLHSLVLIKNPK